MKIWISQYIAGTYEDTLLDLKLEIGVKSFYLSKIIWTLENKYL